HRVDADVDYLEVAADVELHLLEALDQALAHQRAEHRALVVAHHQHYRLGAEVLAESHLLALLIVEGQVEGDLRIKLLVEGHLGDRAGQPLVQGRAGREKHQAKNSQKRSSDIAGQSHSLKFLAYSSGPAPRSSSNSIARSIG